MTSARRIAEEIIKGGRELATRVLDELHLLEGWRSEPPPETPNVEIVIRYLPKFKYVEYETPAAIA